MLQIANPWERRAVSAADAGLRAVAWLRLRRAPPDRKAPIRRILVLRLERIGDLLMSLPTLRALRERAPLATIDLVVGSWNVPLASQVAGIDGVETMDAPWLTRGARGPGWHAIVRQARSWRGRRYDLALNLEGDIRSNLLMGLAGAGRTAGFGMAGGGSLLDDCVTFDPRSHTAVNGVRLVSAAFGGRLDPDPPVEGRNAAASLPRAALTIPASAAANADRLLAGAVRGRLFVGLQVGAGRAVKEWPVSRLAAVAGRLAADGGVTIVLTGAEEDRATADVLRDSLPSSVAVVDLVGRLDIMGLAAVLRRLALFITPDTGPMHLAGVLDVPLVAVFGPSSPERWGPLAARCRIVRTDLPCSPCNRIRTPPARCVGHTPDCLEAVQVDTVYRAARELLAETEGAVRPGRQRRGQTS